MSYDRPPVSDPNVLLQQNKVWRDQIIKVDPDFFKRLAQGQKPSILWIGCSDSRVPETTICGCLPGELFTHRNIANIVQLNDTSIQSVIQFSVGVLGVNHIIVCGHTECGGVKAAWEASKNNQSSADIESSLSQWIAPLVQLSKELGLDKVEADKAIPKLTEGSVRQQIKNLEQFSPVQVAESLQVHGWIFDIAKGELVVV